MATNPKVTRLIAERDTALETIERQRHALAVCQKKIRKLEARLARVAKAKKNIKEKRRK